jgi:nucleotide-binding universal stress UspA family protein
MHGPSLFVVGVDGSETSWRALHYAFGLARRQGSTVVAVFSFVPIITYITSAADVYYAGEDMAAELREAIDALSAELDVAAEFIATERDPVVILTALADERHADAIILGASKTLGHKIFGSKAARMLRRCRCPVIVVP